MKADKQVEILRNANLELQTNIASLNGTVIQLAHQYDLSTNALAEAKARLASVRPLKQRLIALLERISPLILPALKNGTNQFHGTVSEFDITELRSINNEPDAGKYIKSLSIGGQVNVNVGGIAGESQYVTCELQPELAK